MWVTATGSAGAWRQQALCARSQSSWFWCHPASLHFKFPDNNLKVVPRQNRSTGKTETYFKRKYKMHKQEERDDRNKSEPQGELSPGTVSIQDFPYIPFSRYLQFSSVVFFKHSRASPSCYFLPTANCHCELPSLLRFCPKLCITRSSGSVRESSLCPGSRMLLPPDVCWFWCPPPSHSPKKSTRMCKTI